MKKMLLVLLSVFSVCTFAESFNFSGERAQLLYDIIDVTPTVENIGPNPGINPHVGTKVFVTSDEVLKIQCVMRLYSKGCTVEVAKPIVGTAAEEFSQVLDVEKVTDEGIGPNGGINPLVSSKQYDSGNGLKISCVLRLYSKNCNFNVAF